MKYKELKYYVELWGKSKDDIIEVERGLLVSIGNEALAYRRYTAINARQHKNIKSINKIK